MMGNNIAPIPGLDVLGCGYQAVTGQYANVDSCEEQLFDFEKLEKKTIHASATNTSYTAPVKLVQYLDKNLRDSNVASGETVEDYVQNFSASVNLQVGYGGFGGSVKSEFKTSSSYSKFEAYTRYQYNASLWILRLDDTAGNPRDFLKDNVRNDIDNLDPVKLYEKYGTHYVAAIKVGGRCVYTAITNKLKSRNTDSFGIYAEATFQFGAFGSSASAEVTKTSEYQSFKQNSRFQTTISGGDPSAFGLDSKPNLEEWAKTVKAHPVLIDFATRDGLVPIWYLAADDNRRQALKDSLLTYFEQNQLPFKMPDGPVLEARWVVGRKQFNDDGSGADEAFAVYKPELGNEGWNWLAQYGVGPSYPASNAEYKVLIVREKPWAKGVLGAIANWDKIWDDAGSGKSNEYNIWRPIAESAVSYKPLGHFYKAHPSRSQIVPQEEHTGRLFTVHQDFLVRGSVGSRLWYDKGTKADKYGSIWKIDAPEDGIDIGAWIGNNSYDKPSTQDVWCLKKSAVHFL
ncbi:hypothetical protein K7432_009129 [Basidiobolus ranarum]|uniref:MACPF domain-containing protein n=1 Tax=Basidiobolus ranarum TaxID=34480 RepID=A0ABR2VXZ9_9FUNG